MSDVRWYRAVGYSHILKQQGAGAPTTGEAARASPPARSGLFQRAAAAYQRTMSPEGSARTIA